MKPILAGSINREEVDSVWKIARLNGLTTINMSLGEVAARSPRLTSRMVDAMPSLERVLRNAGFKALSRSGSRGFAKTDFTIAHGNISPHSDDNLGMAALVLLKVTPFCKSESVSLTRSPWSNANFLWTNSGLMEMEENDVVVFNGDKEHAWFCDGRAHFVTVLVTKPRKRKGDTVEWS